MRGLALQCAAAAGMNAGGSGPSGGCYTWRAGVQPGPLAAEIAGSLADCISRKSLEAVFPPDRPQWVESLPAPRVRPSARASLPHHSLLGGATVSQHVSTRYPSVTDGECRDAKDKEETIMIATPFS